MLRLVLAPALDPFLTSPKPALQAVAELGSSHAYQFLEALALVGAGSVPLQLAVGWHAPCWLRGLATPASTS